MHNFRLASLLILFCSFIVPLASAQERAIPEDRRMLLESLLKEELAKALGPPFALKGSESREIRLKTDFPKIDKKIGDATVTANVQFPEAQQKLTLQISRLVTEGQMLRGTVSSTCPCTGTLDATAGPFKGHADFTMIAVIDVAEIEAPWQANGNTGEFRYDPQVKVLKTSLKEVHFGGDLARIFGQINDLAQKAANSWLAGNEARLKEEINKAIQKALKDNPLRIGPPVPTK